MDQNLKIGSRSEYQKQILAEMGIVTWQLREPELLAFQPDEVASQQPAKTEEDSEQDVVMQEAEFEKPADAISEPEPQKPVVKPKEYKQKVLVVSSEYLPMADLGLVMELFEIPYEVTEQPTDPEFKYALLISLSDDIEIEAEQKLVISQLSPDAKKQLWQTLLDFKSKVSTQQ